MSECMQEVSRLPSIKCLTSMPYHPICNGLVERWNGTLKSILKRLCQDQPKQWHRLIRTGTILKELWTKEVNIPDVKTSYQYVT